jgi:mycothiol synthase
MKTANAAARRRSPDVTTPGSSVGLRAGTLAEPFFAREFARVTDAAFAADGYRPFNEQALLEMASGRRETLLIEFEATIVGAASLGAGELDLVIAPEYRRRGLAREVLPQLLSTAPADVAAWSHGDHAGARALAARFDFAAVRTLLMLQAELSDTAPADTAPATPVAPLGITLGTFRAGVDDADWVELNALAFAAHPEQGAQTLDDLAARQAEPWFSADDFLLARDTETGRLLGYNWLKIEPCQTAESRVGEIYVVAVHPDAAGRGLGRALMTAGLARLHSRGVRVAELYVEADSAGAVHLYRSLGFVDHTIDVQYRRGQSSRTS